MVRTRLLDHCSSLDGCKIGGFAWGAWSWSSMERLGQVVDSWLGVLGV